MINKTKLTLDELVGAATEPLDSFDYEKMDEELGELIDKIDNVLKQFETRPYPTHKPTGRRGYIGRGHKIYNLC